MAYFIHLSFETYFEEKIQLVYNYKNILYNLSEIKL